jgi:hypothetical protein
MALKRLFQVVAVAEDQAGKGVDQPTLLVPANAGHLVIEPSCTFTPELFERANINRASLSPLQPLAGVVTGTMPFQIELAGTADTGVAATRIPAWSVFLEGAGMRRVTTQAVVIGAITPSGNNPAAFYHGEVVNWTGGDGIVLHDIYDGETLMRIEIRTGVDPTGTLTGAVSLAQATVSSTYVEGTTWYPASVPVQTIGVDGDATNASAVGDVVRGDTSGTIAVLVDAIAQTTADQSVRMRILDGIFTDTETLTNLTANRAAGTIDLNAAEAQTLLPALSMAVNEDSVIKALRGARGTWSIAGNVGEAMILSFEYTGLRNFVTDGAPVQGVTYTSLVPPPLLNCSLDLWTAGEGGGVGSGTEPSQPRWTALSFDHGNSIGIPRDAGEQFGLYGSAQITERSSTGSMTVNVEPEGNFDFINKLNTGEAARIRATIGTELGNQFVISSPSATFTGETDGDQEGIATRDMAFNLGSVRPDGVDADDAEVVISYIATDGT